MKKYHLIHIPNGLYWLRQLVAAPAFLPARPVLPMRCTFPAPSDCEKRRSLIRAREPPLIYTRVVSWHCFSCFSFVLEVTQLRAQAVSIIVGITGKPEQPGRFVHGERANFTRLVLDTAEIEPCKVCPLSVYKSPRSLIG